MINDSLNLSEETIRYCFQHKNLKPAIEIPFILRRAAVLIPLLLDNSEWKILYTRRTDTVQDHKGQVSFPGGAAESDDETSEESALRESFEEIGLIPQDVTIFGTLPEMSTITGYRITPLVGKIPWPYRFQLSADEVSRVFTIPVKWLADRSHFMERDVTFPENLHRNVLFYEEFDGELLWGISAMLTVQLLEFLEVIK